MRAVEAGTSTSFWEPGSQILWRYRENSGAHFHIVRPVTVVRDDEDLLAVWLAPGTECVKPVLADGTSVHAEPLESRYTKPRTVQRDHWFGTGVLKLARPGLPWSVWLFWEPGWQFKNWYVNLEQPLTRWAGVWTPRTTSWTFPCTRTAVGAGSTRTSSGRPSGTG